MLFQGHYRGRSYWDSSRRGCSSWWSPMRSNSKHGSPMRLEFSCSTRDSRLRCDCCWLNWRFLDFFHLALSKREPVGDGGLGRAEPHGGGVLGPVEAEILDDGAHRLPREQILGPGRAPGDCGGQPLARLGRERPLRRRGVPPAPHLPGGGQHHDDLRHPPHPRAVVPAPPLRRRRAGRRRRGVPHGRARGSRSETLGGPGGRGGAPRRRWRRKLAGNSNGAPVWRFN